jgi:transaldolase
VNVTLLFSSQHCRDAADAYMKGLERRVAEGLSPDVRSVASVFVSRWDKAVIEKVPAELKDKLGIAVSTQAYRDYRDMLDSDRWQQLQSMGARPQRLLFASTSTKDPSAPDTLYVEALAAPNTVNTTPDKTLLAFGDHGKLSGVLSRDGGDCEDMLAAFEKAGISISGLAAQLQQEGAASFAKSWEDLLQSIETKSKALG